jgi:hypothetical protein
VRVLKDAINKLTDVVVDEFDIIRNEFKGEIMIMNGNL